MVLHNESIHVLLHGGRSNVDTRGRAIVVVVGLLGHWYSLPAWGTCNLVWWMLFDWDFLDLFGHLSQMTTLWRKVLCLC